MLEKFTKNLIPIAIIIAGIIIAGVLFYLEQEKSTEEISENPSPQETAEKTIDYINENMLQEGTTASLISVVEENGVYKFRLKIAEKEYDSYVTKDGELLFTEGINMKKSSEQGEINSEEISKTDSPDVKLFVMSYCPFGLQAMKMFLPVYDLLKDEAKIEMYFVDYIMHDKKEIDENLRQYCIQKQEKEKYSGYLSCFVADGDFEKCLSENKIDNAKLTACVSETDTKYNITSQYNNKDTWLNGKFPKFDVHSELNKEYGVKGSPTVVINDKIVSISPRSPEKFKSVICQAFSSLPQDCSQTLSDDVPSPGIGGGTGSSDGGGCAK